MLGVGLVAVRWLPVTVSSRRNPNELVGTVTVLRGNDVVKIFTDSV